AFWQGDACNWVGLDVNEHTKHTFYRTLGYDFYEGTSGIAFFLSQLYKQTGENIFKRTAVGALNHAFENAQKKPGNFPIGFYHGKSGLLYVLIHAAELMNDSSFHKKALIVAGEILKIKISKLHFDIISGAAGAIPVLLLASEKLKNKALKKYAVDLGDYLLSNSVLSENARSWKLKNQNHLPLTGFSHGTSGIGYALALLFKYTGDEKYARAAAEAFNYEDKHFDKEKKNWPDLRDVHDNEEKKISDKGHMISAWCYGAPGIGMARLAAYRIFKNDAYLKWVNPACENVVESLKQPANHSLCHGCFGNAELLLQYTSYFNNGKFNNALKQVADSGIELNVLENYPWICGTPDGIYTPAFMTGISGIGNFYLRMHSPEKIASGLILEELL
ncbi:MAG: type 2 lanthipeptide synthetase LanM, partial [Bacteroidia bacterium]